MKKDVVILVAEDDEGHFLLVKANLKRAGVQNKVVRFADGQELLEFLFETGPKPHRQPHKEYILLLDIRMPKVDGIEVLEKMKQDNELKKIPVIILTTTDDPHEVEYCHSLGCSLYIVKPVGYEAFADAIKKVGMFLSVVEVPVINNAC